MAVHRTAFGAGKACIFKSSHPAKTHTEKVAQRDVDSRPVCSIPVDLQAKLFKQPGAQTMDGHPDTMNYSAIVFDLRYGQCFTWPYKEVGRSFPAKGTPASAPFSSPHVFRTCPPGMHTFRYSEKIMIYHSITYPFIPPTIRPVVKYFCKKG